MILWVFWAQKRKQKLECRVYARAYLLVFIAGERIKVREDRIEITDNWRVTKSLIPRRQKELFIDIIQQWSRIADNAPELALTPCHSCRLLGNRQVTYKQTRSCSSSCRGGRTARFGDSGRTCSTPATNATSQQPTEMITVCVCHHYQRQSFGPGGSFLWCHFL